MAKKKSKDIGLGAKAPQKSCNNIKCPWHGQLKLRGRVFRGKVVSSTQSSAVVEWDYYQYIKKYERYERRKTRIAVHNPTCISANVNDNVRIAECRPLSKTKNFVIFEKMVKSK